MHSNFIKSDSTTSSSFIDRFYTKYYYHFLDTSTNEVQEHLVLVHSNNICLIQVTNRHPGIVKGIERCNFNIGNTDRSLNIVRGKGKKGGLVMQEKSTVAVLQCKNGSNYKVVSCIPGKLIEINELLREDSNLLSKEGMLDSLR